jgi:AcrR family transcriptional regulator
VTVRAVAEAAGVSPALVYHHFTDKDDLIGRSLDRMAVDLSAAAEVQSPPAALRQLWRRLDERPAFARIIVWYVLEGRDVSALMSNHPLIARVAARAAEDGIGDPATLGGRMAILGPTPTSESSRAWSASSTSRTRRHHPGPNAPG